MLRDLLLVQPAFQLNIGMIKEMAETDDGEAAAAADAESHDSPSPPPIEEEALKYNGERRRSSFCLKKLAPPSPDNVEGTFKLIGSENYEQFLRMVGCGPLSLNMVMRANVVLTVAQASPSIRRGGGGRRVENSS